MIMMPKLINFGRDEAYEVKILREELLYDVKLLFAICYLFFGLIVYSFSKVYRV